MAVLFYFYTNMATFQDFKDKALTGIVAFAFGMMWYDIREVKNDVKTLIVQTSESKAKIEALERSVFKTASYKTPFPPDDYPKDLKIQPVAIMNKDEDDYMDNKDI